jgi:HYR domain/Secretion system C-terminal sorting domain
LYFSQSLIITKTKHSQLMRSFCKLIVLFFLLTFAGQNKAFSQTTLAAGDLAFSGYISDGDGSTISDRFSFVLLAPVTSNTVIRFTDYGWRTDLNAFSSGTNLESELVFTTNAAYPAGTEITITTNNITGNPTPVANLVGGGSAGTITVTTGASFLAGNMALSTNGDQIFAYQGSFASPQFIAGIHKNAYSTANGDPTTTTAAAWDGVIPGASLNATSSGKPAALTTGTNAIWIGSVNALAPFTTEFDNAYFACGPDVSTAALARAALNTAANWTTSDVLPSTSGSPVPTGCNYLGILSAPTINTNPSSTTICEGANTSFTITATNATGYQWQVDNGGGFVNITNNTVYSGATTATLNITAAPASLNGFIYRCVASNGSGSANSTGATLTVTALPVSPTLLAKTPNTATVADGTPVSATFNAGSGGTGCSDDFRYTTNGGVSYLPYTPGSNISTTGLAAGSGTVTIEGRRAGCASCSGGYVALATWIVTPLPAAATTLNAGDIAFSGYTSTTAGDDFSFVLLRNIGPGTVINFTDNGWLSTNVFRTGEQTITWTSNAAYSAGIEIKISGLTATLASGGSAGTVTGTALSLSVTGDQILAYRGSSAAPTFISAIHMNVFSTLIGDPVSTTASVWDGSANTTNSSALPTGLTTGVNCIWIGTQDVTASEFLNSRYGNCSGPGTLGSVATLRAALNNQANWISDNNTPPSFTLPTGCSYLGVGTLPNITGQPANASICELANSSFTVTVSGATAYQWQVDNGGGFTNISNGAPYSGATTTTLTITAAPLSLNSYLYRCITSNGSGSSTSNSASLTVTVLPVGPTLLAKTPAGNTVPDGTPVSATFNPGSGGTGCSDDFRYTTDGGVTYLPYTPGSNISTTGLAAGSGHVFIEGRRANCSAGCQGVYTVLALWRVTPLPVAPTTLAAGDIAFSGYTSGTPGDDFSFVLLKNIGAGTVINFTDNGWLSTNVFRTGEQTVTWTAPAGGLFAGTEITISALTATKSGGGAAGTVTGTTLSLSTTGDQILAYTGTVGAPTFISAIHMNVYNAATGDPVTTTAAAWDGTANTTNSSALPTGLTTGVNAIWIGTQGVPSSEFENSRYGTCAGPGSFGPLTGLRAALNNQANWISTNGAPPGFTLPTACNYLQLLVPVVNITGTPLSAFTTCSGTPSAEQNFVVSGSALTGDIVINAPAGFEISITSGSGFASALTLTQSGGGVANTTIYVRLSAAASGTPSGNITVASTGVTTQNVAVSGTVGTAPTTAAAGADASVCALTYTLAGNAAVSGTGTWTQTAGPGTSTFTDINSATSDVTVTVSGAYTFQWSIASPGCPSSTDDVIITFTSTPTTANAGADRSLCLPSSSLNLAGNAPASGTGTWTFISGPSTPAITNPGSPTTSVIGLNTVGIYTLVWTISNPPCLASTDTMTVTVSNSPSFFNVIGANACGGSTVTLAGAVDPNYTYTWSRSLSGISGTFGSFGGTAQTQAVTVSGSYQLVTTNQFGCSMTDTAIVHIGDYFFNGTLATGDAQLTNRINRFGQVSTCASPKACPGVFSGSGARLYDSYTIINRRNAPVCATIGLASSCGTNIFNVAYLKSFDPANPCTNYLADPGSSFPASGFMEVTIPALDTILIVVHEVNGGTGCAGYFLSVDVPRDPSSISVSPTPPICNGAPVTLTGAAADTYSWTPGGATTQFINVTPLITTQYNVTYGYGNHGCIRLDSTTVTSAPAVTTAFAGNDTATCGTSITLAANTPTTGTGAWSEASGNPGTISFGNASSPTSTASASVNGSYKLYWTITAGAPCPGTSIDSVIVNFDAQPTANAGPDLTVCASPGSRTLSGVAPSVGSGSWQFISGPATASIFPPPTNPNAGVVGMTVPGTYTFVWTVTNGSCPFARDTMVVVSNPSPAVPTITGGGVTVCEGSTVTLSGIADPNYTYSWDRSFGSNGAAFSSVGTGQTLATTVSGVFRLTVTNQFGCAATSGQSIVHVADYVFDGSIGAGDAQQTGRINRFGTVSTCAAPKACPGIFSTTGARLYDSYQIINTRNVPVCATIGTNNPCGTNIFTVAYLKSFDPSNTCTNYLGDPGSSFTLGGFFEVTIPANDTIVVVVHEVNVGQGCANYRLTVNVPRDMSGIVINPPTVTCAGTATLTAPVAASYLWSPGGATTQSITTAPLFTNTQYNVTLGYGNNGCTREDSTTVVVTSLPPTVSCPANISLTNTTGQCGRAVTYTTTIGGTPTPTLTYTFTGATTGSGSGNGSGSFFNVGTTTVTVTATNACGSVNCSFTVTITDNEAPIVTTGIIGSCYPTVAAAQAAALAATTATDNCPGVLVETASTVGTCSAVITVRTTDVAGNFTEVTYNTRIDNTAPTVTVGTIGSCYPTAAAAEAAALAATSATDNCPGALTEVASTVGTCSAVITVTTTDVCGNATAVTYNTRIDNTAPVFACTPITVSCAADVPAPNTATIGVTDNCPGTITVIHVGDVISNIQCANRYTITRTYRATDVCGNTSECAQIITVNDNIPPTMVCPAPVTVSCAENVPAPNVASVTGLSDNCGGGSGFVTVTFRGDVISNQTCANRYTITRTYRATDVCGNFTECTQIITVNDQTPPTLTCPAPVTVSCASAVPAPSIAAVTGVSDNCAGTVTVTHVGDVISNQTCANRYTITRTYRATDVCGNFAECTQIITVNDQTPPVLTCPAPVTVSCASAVPAPSIAAVTGVSDNCGGTVTVTHVGDVISNQTCANRYTITRTYRATDVCGNFAECTQIITVNDQTAPVITCPANVTVTAVGTCTVPVSYAAATATDNCGGAVTITYSRASGSTFTVGTNVVTVTATDVCGNSSTCTFNVIVLDGQIPAVTTAPANRIVCAGTNATFTVTATNAVSYQWQTFTGGNWVNIPGATGSTLTLNNVTTSMNGTTYRVNVIGLCTTTTSTAATLTVNALPTITITSSISPFLVPGRILTLSAIPSPAGGSFAWLKNNGIIPNETSATLAPVNIDGLGSYRVRYTDLNGCVSVSDELVVGADKSDKLFIYPNPNNGKFQVRFYEDRPQVVTINVYDAGGKIIYQNKTFTTGPYSQLNVDLGAGTRGTYVVEVLKTNGERVGAKQILVTLF